MLFAPKQVAAKVAVGIFTLGLLNGCGTEIQIPETPENIETGLEQLGDDIAEQANRFKDYLNGVVDTTLPVNEQIDQLQEGFCNLSDSKAVDALRKAAKDTRDQIAEDNPNTDVPEVDLDPDKCP